MGNVGKSSLSKSYWLALGALLISSVMLSLIGFPLGWIGIAASITSAVRVPLLQRRHLQGGTDLLIAQPALPSPLALLFSSLALNIVFGVVSFIAFAAMCIPGTIAFGLGDVSNTVASASGLFGLVCFFLMFFLSLRLRF